MNLRWWNPISWIAVPAVSIARGIRSLFPWTQDGRRTSLHVAVLGAGPALTGITVWIMHTSLDYKLYDTFTKVAFAVAAALLIVVSAIAVGTGLNIFVKADKSGATVSAGSDENVVEAAHKVADAAQEKATEIEKEFIPEYEEFPDDTNTSKTR